jgi:hypothetical protein
VLSEHVNEVPQSHGNGQGQRSRSASPARGVTGVTDSTPPPVPTHTAHNPVSNPGAVPQFRSVSPPPPGVSESGNSNYQHGNGSGSVNGNIIVDHNTQRLPSHSTADAVKPPAIPNNSTVNSTANTVQAARSATPPPPAPVSVTSSLVSNDEKQPAAEIAKGGCCVIA